MKTFNIKVSFSHNTKTFFMWLIRLLLTSVLIGFITLWIKWIYIVIKLIWNY